MLHTCQRAALEHVAVYARGRREQARDVLAHILEMSNLAQATFDEAVRAITTRARVALHFHPDRRGPDGRTVAESLRETGIYKSQFETQLSGGSLSAHPGGQRDRWEHRLFGGAYTAQSDDLRPKYGGLDLLGHPDGPSPRFGSCYFLLDPAVAGRCTFSFSDSHLDPPHKGTLGAFDDVLAALYTESFERDFALGERPLRPPALTRRLIHYTPQEAPARNLDHYIEAQVHGEVSLQRDVQVLVADPSYRGTLEELCHEYRIELRWHQGFSLAVGRVPDDFRGPAMPALARRVHPREITPRRLGEAAGQVDFQDLKRLWHIVVKFGRWGPAVAPGAAPSDHARQG